MMKNSKKLLALVLVALSCLSLVACAATPVASPEASKAPAAEETAAPAESAQAPAEEAKGDVKLSIVMLGYKRYSDRGRAEQGRRPRWFRQVLHDQPREGGSRLSRRHL